MPKGPPKDVKKMKDYSTPPKTRAEVSACLKAHFLGYIEWEGVDDHIATFPIKLQQTVNIYYEYPGRTIEETAEVMGCNPWMINSYLRDVRERLLKIVKEEWDGDES